MVKVTKVVGPARASINLGIKQFDNQQVKVGWFESAKYADGTPVAYVAAIQEFGYAPKNIPPRLGLRALTQTRKREEWIETAGTLAKKVMTGTSVDDALTILGQKVASDIQRHITQVDSPPLKPATIEARAAKTASGKITTTLAKPLEATGLMRGSVQHVRSKK